MNKNRPTLLHWCVKNNERMLETLRLAASVKDISTAPAESHDAKEEVLDARIGKRMMLLSEHNRYRCDGSDGPSQRGLKRGVHQDYQAIRHAGRALATSGNPQS